uniref:Low-affinity cation transporter n=1 Tax=Oryza sativa subsp. indica TaxID=39946 RepID=A0A8F1B4S6_ORYSI|nr:low-affinity cation transporter [Oryza sativa Indica Group]
MANELSATPPETQPAIHLHDEASPPSGTMENGAGDAAGGSRRVPTTTAVSPPPPTPAAPSFSQADEDGLAAERKQEEEQQQSNAKAKANLEAGGIAVVFGFAVLTGWLCLPSEAKLPSNTRFTVSLLLAFGTFVSGNCLMFLSMNMIGLRRRLVTGAQRGASRCLSVLCAALSAMTLASLLALLPGRVYLCLVGVAVLTAVALPVAAAHWYVARRSEHGGAGAGGDAEYRAEVEAAWKTTSGVTNSAFGGLVGVLSGASKIAGAATSRTTATYVAIFFMFSTAIVGMFVMTLSKKVLDVTNRRFQRFLVGAIRLLNAFLLCSLASAALAASYVVLGFRMVAAFAPLAVTFIVFLLLHHCTPRRAVRRRSGPSEERLKATEDIASKVTAATLGAIMSVLGGSLGEEDHRKAAAGPLDAVMVILTSAFVSGFGFMLLAAMPASSSARARLAPVAKVLAWSSMAMFAATAVAVYGVDARRI